MKSKREFRNRTVRNWDHGEDCKEQLYQKDKKSIASERLPVSSICDLPEMVEATTTAVAWFTPREACCSWARFGLSLPAFTCRNQAYLGSHNIEWWQGPSQKLDWWFLMNISDPLQLPTSFSKIIVCGVHSWHIFNVKGASWLICLVVSNSSFIRYFNEMLHLWKSIWDSNK